MERARWNTELSPKKLNFVTCLTFWGHTRIETAFLVQMNRSVIFSI